MKDISKISMKEMCDRTEKTFNKVMIAISRKAKLEKLAGKEIENTKDYNLDDISIIVNSNITETFINRLVKEPDEDVIIFMLYMLDVNYKLHSHTYSKNKSVESFLANKKLEHHRKIMYKQTNH